MIERCDIRVFELPTANRPERDGTASWSATTMVLVDLASDGAHGLGYSYVTAAAAAVIRDVLLPCVVGAQPTDQQDLHSRMLRAVRNHGRQGIAACAISAVDIALWDLRARMLDVPIATLLGSARHEVPVYASGGFTSTPLHALAHEIEGYVAAGHTRVKIKIGQPLTSAVERVRTARSAAGPATMLMVDANGAYTANEARELAHRVEESDVAYFEEPVSSDDLAGLRLLRGRIRPAVAAGEYGYGPLDARRMLEAGAVDILQADATRCLGFTGFTQADALCDAFGTPLSAHCAPALHVHAGRAARRLVHVEHFFDHVRMEGLLFDGVPTVAHGCLVADPSRKGLGLALRPAEAARLAVGG